MQCCRRYAGAGATACAGAASRQIRAVAQGIANFAVLLVARDKGMFKEQNLDVTWSFVSQGALGVEAVFGGSPSSPATRSSNR